MCRKVSQCSNMICKLNQPILIRFCLLEILQYHMTSSVSVSYCALIPRRVRGSLEDHAQQTGCQEGDHRQQTNILPKILVHHWRAPLEHHFNVI